MDSVEKLKENANLWFLAQDVEKESEALVNAGIGKITKRWRPPPEPWLKCNIGASWLKENRTGGGAWALRDFKGVVVMHSRKSFCDIDSKSNANLMVLLWAIECIKYHKLNKVIFATEDSDFVGAVIRPQAWPSFKYQGSEILLALNFLDDWKLEMEILARNRGVSLIAQSVTRQDRRQFYVAIGHPAWLANLFVDEISSS